MRTPVRAKTVHCNGYGALIGTFGIWDRFFMPFPYDHHHGNVLQNAYYYRQNSTPDCVVSHQTPVAQHPLRLCHHIEGVFQALSDKDIQNAEIAFTYDDHGHPELGKISKSHIIDNLVDKT